MPTKEMRESEEAAPGAWGKFPHHFSAYPLLIRLMRVNATTGELKAVAESLW